VLISGFLGRQHADGVTNPAMPFLFVKPAVTFPDTEHKHTWMSDFRRVAGWQRNDRGSNWRPLDRCFSAPLIAVL